MDFAQLRQSLAADLLDYGITLQQLSAKIAAADRSFQAGTLRDNGKQIAIMGGQTLQSPSDIANILISARDGRRVSLPLDY